MPTGASSDSHSLCCGWRAPLLQWGVWRFVNAGSGPWFPCNDWGRASYAAVLLPGGGAADGKPDGSAHPQGWPIWDYFILLLFLSDGYVDTVYTEQKCAKCALRNLILLLVRSIEFKIWQDLNYFMFSMPHVHIVLPTGLWHVLP